MYTHGALLPPMAVQTVPISGTYVQYLGARAMLFMFVQKKYENGKGEIKCGRVRNEIVKLQLILIH